MLQLYGSSRSSFGLKESDVNIEVCGKGPAPKLLLDVFSILHKEQGEHPAAFQYLAALKYLIDILSLGTGFNMLCSLAS